MVDYPNTIFTPRVLANKSGVTYDAAKTTTIFSKDFNDPAAEIVAIETELGANARGAYATVRAWLDALASAISGFVPTSRTVNGHALTGNISVTVTDLSLQNVDNTSDATKNAAAVTLTNKRITKRVDSQASTDTITPEISTYDIFVRTAQAHALVINNHSSSTPVDGDMMLFEILSDATPREITYGDKYVANAGVALPSTTVASKNLTMLFIWRADLSKWNLLGAGQEA